VDKNSELEVSQAIERQAIAHKSSLHENDLNRLASLIHSSPHSILGAHPVSEGVKIRVFRPDAKRISLIRDDKPVIDLEKTDERGLFEVLAEDTKEVFKYLLKIQFPDGNEIKIRDPYSFLPSLGDLDLYLFGEGRHEKIYTKLGANLCEVMGVSGVSFAVWAPNAEGISVIGDFNYWDGRIHMMRSLGSSGVWEIFIPDLRPGVLYKFEIRGKDGQTLVKADPYAKSMEMPPCTASIVHESKYHFSDQEWMENRSKQDLLKRPMSVYEMHLGSWRRVPEEWNRPLKYRELAPLLADYVLEMGFTHVEFMPVMEHPFGGSWGYQVSAYYSPTARYGTPDDFKYLVDYLHQKGIGVILDWVPAHFPKDMFALGRFDGTGLYEHVDPKQGEHPDWGTFIFNYSRNEVRNFLMANALFWFSEYHVDGLRIDAVASMLYLDYSRSQGQWIPNRHGGRENLEVISFLKELNEITHSRFPGALMIAEESTAWTGVSRPTYLGGLGFGYKWNMGWMHDTLSYFVKDAIYRRYHQHHLTFGFIYAWTENFILPLSHDEVVHGKGAMLSKMPGDRWQKFANLRSLYAYMWAHPGKKLLFMGSEFGQWNEWNHNQSLDWHVLWGYEHSGVQRLLKDLNRVYRDEPALWESDSEPAGFQWIDFSDADANIIAFVRTAVSSGRQIVCVCNFSPVARHFYRLGLPKWGWYREIVNTDAKAYGGSNVGNSGGVMSESIPWQGYSYSASLNLPPLAVLWLEVPR